MKKLFLVLLGLVAAFLALAALMPKDFKIEKEIVIEKPVSEVFNYLKITKNAKDWCPWMKKDPNVTQEFTGEDGTVGFIESWSGNKEVGVGEREITNIVANQRIDFELRFEKPMKATHQGYLITEDLGNNQTKVIWGMTGRTNYPFNLVCFFMQKKVGHEFSQGLESLKEVLEGGKKDEAVVEEKTATDVKVEMKGGDTSAEVK